MAGKTDDGQSGHPNLDEVHMADVIGRTLFAKDAASNSFGHRLLEVKPGYARVSMRVKDSMLNGHGTCHGGIVFAVADSAFAFACNSHNVPTVASAASIDFLAPARAGDELTAEAREIWRSKRNGLYEVDVVDQTGRRVAVFRGRSYSIGGRVIEDGSTAGS